MAGPICITSWCCPAFSAWLSDDPRTYGEAKNLLLAALSSQYQHPKIAIAVDADVDIFNPSELLWALSTRVNPQEDVVIIAGTHNHAMDASLPNSARRAHHYGDDVARKC